MKKILGIKLGFDELKICLILSVNSFTVFFNEIKTSFCQLPKINQDWYKVTHFVYEFVSVKFMYSEKATKFCEISTNYLTGST